MINLEKYKQELMSKINFEKNIKNNDKFFIMINQDMKSKENKCNYEIINYNSTNDFEKLFNNFIQNDNKENNSHIINNSINRELSSKNEKKKSKFSNQNSISNNKIKNGNSSINQYFPPLILKYTELKDIIDNIEKNL